MNVLVATPVRRGTPWVFLDMCDAVYSSLTWADKERAILFSDEGGPRFIRHGTARNRLVELYLKDRHTHLLWLDVDLVSVPPDLIEKLVEVGRGHIVAPLVLLDPGRELPHGVYAQFYDVAAFVKDGKPFTQKAPYCQGQTLIEMDSVGTCYLIPASVYRQGIRYEAPSAEEVEHISLMRAAREAGYKIYARRDVQVYHADIPAMGLDWHKDRGGRER